MKPVMPLGDFLVAYLKRIGVERFAIIEVTIAPGDLSPLARRFFTARRNPRRPR